MFVKKYYVQPNHIKQTKNPPPHVDLLLCCDRHRIYLQLSRLWLWRGYFGICHLHVYDMAIILSW